MGLLDIITALWISSVIFYWAAIVFGIALIILSVYILVTDWNGVMEWFDQMYGKVKQWGGK